MNDKQIVLGVDGGGTKTDYLLFDIHGGIIDWMRGKGTNHEILANGMDELESHLGKTIRGFLKRNAIEPHQIAAAVFGMSGVDVPEQKAAVEGIVSRMGFIKFIVINDSFIGIKAGSEKGYGICAVNGTGNTIGGIDRNGRRLQVGGAGWISGVEGGAGRIAEHVLRAVYEEFFCLGKSTMLSPLVFELLDTREPENFIQAVYDKYNTGLVKPKTILKLLFECANKKDEISMEILTRIGKQIAKCIAGCAKRLDFGDELDVVLVGSVFNKATCPIMMQTLKSETVNLINKKISFIPLKTSPAIGSVLWAIEIALAHLPSIDVIERVRHAAYEVYTRIDETRIFEDGN